MFKTDNLVVVLRAKPEESDCFAVILSPSLLVIPSGARNLAQGRLREGSHSSFVANAPQDDALASVCNL
jgi:hypothetical protein